MSNLDSDFESNLDRLTKNSINKILRAEIHEKSDLWRDIVIRVELNQLNKKIKKQFKLFNKKRNNLKPTLLIEGQNTLDSFAKNMNIQIDNFISDNANDILYKSEEFINNIIKFKSNIIKNVTKEIIIPLINKFKKEG